MGDILRTLESDNGDVHENIAEKQTPHPFKSNYFANIPSHPVSKKKGTQVGAEERGPRPSPDKDCSRIYRLAVSALK